MTAKQIDRMPIEELESLAYNLTPEQLIQWTGSGYDGTTYAKLTNSREKEYCAYSGLTSPKAYE